MVFLVISVLLVIVIIHDLLDLTHKLPHKGLLLFLPSHYISDLLLQIAQYFKHAVYFHLQSSFLLSPDQSLMKDLLG